MDFELSEEQLAYRDAVIDFAQRELNKDLLQRDADGNFSTDAWRKCAEFGLQGLPVPEEYGGQDADALTIVLAMESLGYGCRDNGLIFSLNAQMWSCEIPLVRFGSEEQKRRYLPRLCDGSLIGVQGMTEAGSGSDAFSLSTTARLEGDTFILNGAKTFITNAPVADLFVVFASMDRSKGAFGLSAFLVERGTPGLMVGSPFHKMGLRTSPMSELIFTECRISRESMLGPLGAGMAIFNHSMDWERSCILASAVGTMQRQLETSVAYARERRQFGQPIGKFQAVAHKLVDMKVRLEAGRLLLYHLGWLKANGKPTALESAMVKLFLSEAFVESSLETIQVHGGYGYMAESELERDLRDAIAGRIYSGTSEIQRNLIARHLGL
jgi:alkylation response protein AidB-like acyl-CoA dehydrogenase